MFMSTQIVFRIFKFKRLIGNEIYSFRQYPAPRKRFFKNVFVSESNGGFEINLDKKKLKTPLGRLLKLPNEGLASSVAAEWDMQGEHLQLHNMHLTNLCNTVIDNPSKLNKETLADATLEYLHTDTLCYRNREPPELLSLQVDKWDPVLEWFKKEFQVEMPVSEDVISVPLAKETVTAIKKHLLSFNLWSLTGISYAAENLKSLVLTLAILYEKLDIENAIELSRLEVVFQTEKWGKVEWSHDLELMQTSSRVAAGILFVYLNKESIHFAKKNATTME